MTQIKGYPQLEVIPGTRLKRLIKPFPFYSAKIKAWKIIPAGFVYDEESTPWRGENPVAGLIHDFLSRKDSVDVTKHEAALIYKEFQEYEDNLMTKRKWYTKWHDFIWRNIKAGFVAICPDPVYWHKYSINTPWEEMA